MFALTFGTLLSSQGSGAHRSRPFGRSRGNPANLLGRRRGTKPLRVLLATLGSRSFPRCRLTPGNGCRMVDREAAPGCSTRGVRLSLPSNGCNPQPGTPREASNRLALATSTAASAASRAAARATRREEVAFPRDGPSCATLALFR